MIGSLSDVFHSLATHIPLPYTKDIKYSTTYQTSARKVEPFLSTYREVLVHVAMPCFYTASRVFTLPEGDQMLGKVGVNSFQVVAV